jgi:hypothetical protein
MNIWLQSYNDYFIKRNTFATIFSQNFSKTGKFTPQQKQKVSRNGKSTKTTKNKKRMNLHHPPSTLAIPMRQSSFKN